MIERLWSVQRAAIQCRSSIERIDHIDNMRLFARAQPCSSSPLSNDHIWRSTDFGPCLLIWNDAEENGTLHDVSVIHFNVPRRIRKVPRTKSAGRIMISRSQRCMFKHHSSRHRDQCEDLVGDPEVSRESHCRSRTIARYG